jgi:hypothetical protein
MRDDPVTVAKASIIFKGAVERDYAAMDAEPSPERIEVARQMLLFNGDELEYELNEEGSPPCYNPPLELVEEVRQRLLAEKYELREEIRHVMFSRED